MSLFTSTLSNATLSTATLSNATLSNANAAIRVPLLMAFAVVAVSMGTASFAIVGDVSVATADTADATAGFPRMARVTGDRVNVRHGPSTNHRALTQYNRGTEIVALSVEGIWLKTIVEPNQAVWIHSDFVRATDATSVEVTGSRVLVRGTPGTEFTHLGVAKRGDRLRTTGRLDKSGAWVECLAPPTLVAYIHKDYVQLGRKLSAKEMSTLLSGTPAIARPVPAVSKGKEGTVRTSSPTDPGDDPVALRGASTRIRALHEKYREERTKDIREWEFSQILRDLQEIRRTSEDLGEIEASELLIEVVNDARSFRQDIVKLERKRDVARERVASGEQKESDVSKAVHQIPPSAGSKEYLASGWVVLLGKHSEVDGTHKLVKGNKTLYYLQSETLKLDDYVNKRVGIRGYKKELPGHLGADLVQVTEIRVLSK